MLTVPRVTAPWSNVGFPYDLPDHRALDQNINNVSDSAEVNESRPLVYYDSVLLVPARLACVSIGSKLCHLSPALGSKTAEAHTTSIMSQMLDS